MEDLKMKICPKCKKRTLHPEPAMNSLSRYEDLYICNRCGEKEAFIDWALAEEKKKGGKAD